MIRRITVRETGISQYHKGPIKDTPWSPWTSRHYGIWWFKGDGSQCGIHSTRLYTLRQPDHRFPKPEGKRSQRQNTSDYETNKISLGTQSKGKLSSLTQSNQFEGKPSSGSLTAEKKHKSGSPCVKIYIYIDVRYRCNYTHSSIHISLEGNFVFSHQMRL